jgi:hypothetical protein
LAIWAPERLTWIEVDASRFATGGVIYQKCEDTYWHPIAYWSQSMNKAECNYEIYNCKMLAITEALKDWHMYLEKLPQPFKIITDHCNLEFWRTAQNLTHCQARWTLLLANYDFVLIHKPEVKNGASDRLSYQSHHKVSDAEDNNDQVILSFKHFHRLAATAVAVAPYFSLFFVFFSPALIATAPHTWLSHGCHAEATRSSCSAHSASFASRIIGYLVTRPFQTLAATMHLSHQSHVTRWSVRSTFSIKYPTLSLLLAPSQPLGLYWAR